MISHYENPIRPLALVYSVCTLLANRYSLAISSANYLVDSTSFENHRLLPRNYFQTDRIYFNAAV